MRAVQVQRLLPVFGSQIDQLSTRSTELPYLHQLLRLKDLSLRLVQLLKTAGAQVPGRLKWQTRHHDVQGQLLQLAKVIRAPA